MSITLKSLHNLSSLHDNSSLAGNGSVTTGNSTKTIIEMTFHSIIFAFGTLGNLLVVIVILRNRSTRCATNWLILNLAVSDLCITIFNIPMSNLYRFTGWPFGANLCKYFLGGFGESIVGVSVFTHTSLALTRYHVVLNPRRCIIKLKQVLIGIAGIWVLAYASLSAPLTGVFILVYSPVIDGYVCKPSWPSFEYKLIYRSCVLILTYVVPMALASYCYARIFNALKTSINFFRNGSAHTATQVMKREYKSKRLTKALIILYIFFTITTLPLEMFYLLIDAHVLPVSIYLAHVWSLLVALFYSLSVVNPTMLFYISEDYRNQLFNLFRCCCCKPEKEEGDDVVQVPRQKQSDLFPTQQCPLSGVKRGGRASIPNGRKSIEASIELQPFNQRENTDQDAKAEDFSVEINKKLTN